MPGTQAERRGRQVANLEIRRRAQRIVEERDDARVRTRWAGADAAHVARA
jgi:hypothetical protein